MPRIVVHMHRGGEQATKIMTIYYTVEATLNVLKSDGWIIDRWEGYIQ